MRNADFSVSFPRGRSFGSGLAVLFAVACADAGPGPIGEAVARYEEPLVEAVDGTTRVENRGPAETLIVYGNLPSRDLTLLFLDGRSATPLRDGGSAWADMEGGRVVRFDGDGVVREVLAGAPAQGPPLTRPAFIAFEGESVLAVEIDGGALRFTDSEAVGWRPATMPGQMVGGSGRPVAATRTVFDIVIAPLSPDEPLLWTEDGSGGVRAVGRIRMPAQAMLAPVVNSGWVAPAPDGSIVYASAVRPELQRFGPDGSLEWVATWTREGVAEPAFGIADGTLVPRFRLIQQAVVVGPDRRIYVLATTGDEGPADRLLVFEPDGTLLREARIDAEAAIYLATSGHVYSVASEEALARTEADRSTVVFEAFVLPELDGDGEVRLEDYRGKVVVVNFWASWCAPCRQEMPLLDAFSRELDPEEAVVIGLNEDVASGDAIAFLREIGGVSYPVAEGGGKLRERYGYRGLPYTVVLDREGRLTKAIYGFGKSIDPIREATFAAIAAGAEGG
jgi:thiol-disulfide isomerase/thioredoxin